MPRKLIKVYQLDKLYELVAEYASVKKASEVTGVSQPNISNCCLGRTTSAGGYIWMYEQTYLNGEWRAVIKNLSKASLEFAQRNKCISRKQRVIVQCTLTYEYVNKYKSLKEASTITGISASSISACTYGRYGYATAGGYKWMFEDEYNEMMTSHIPPSTTT